MYEETNNTEFGVNFNKVFEQSQQVGSDMTMAKKKNPAKQPTKKVMVEAIVNLEDGLHSCFQKTYSIEYALREYISWKGDGDEFQTHLNEEQEKRNEAAKTAAASEHSGEQSEPSGGSTPPSEE
jgi:hypothetical protein